MLFREVLPGVKWKGMPEEYYKNVKTGKKSIYGNVKNEIGRRFLKGLPS